MSFFDKFKQFFGGGSQEITSIVLSPEPPPRSGFISIAPKKLQNKKKIGGKQYVFGAEHVGGKGANLLRLRAAGVNVPPFMVVPAAEWDDALQRASEQARTSLTAWLSDEGSSENVQIAEALDKIELSEEVVGLIKAFMENNPKRAFAVRSSATVEDGSDSAFAGQFVTVLNVHGLENIINAVKTCWKSLISDSVRPFYKTTLEKQPRMAVVIQEQVDSACAGVYFQANPVTGATSTHIVNAAYGQGEGVVSGKAPSDEYWLSAPTGICFKRSIAKKHERIALAEVADGTRTDPVVAEQQEIPVLSDKQLQQLVDEGKKVKVAFISPQDIEFGFTKDGELLVFQSRPITTRLENMKFEINDVGLFRLNAHVAAPMSALYDPIWREGWSKGCTYNSKLTGSGFYACDTVSVNGFGYFCLRFPGPKAPPTAPPPKFVMRTILTLTGGKDTKAAKQFWEKKNYLDFVQEFETKLKPDWINKHHKLQKEAESVLTRDQALTHLNNSYEHLKEAWYAHCTYTLQHMLPAANFVQQCMDWTKCSEGEAWSCLEGFSPVTSGIGGEFAEQIKIIKASSEALAVLNSTNIDSKEVLSKMRGLTGDVGAAASKIINDMEYRLASGYDPANDIIKEHPELLVAAIKVACEKPEKSTIESAEKAATELRHKVPETKHSLFDSMLSEVRSIMKLRDERAIYTDLWAAGILHDAVIRCASILEHSDVSTANASGARFKHLLLEASIEEIRQALQDGVTPELLQLWKERKLHRETASIKDAPDLIGGVDVEITPEHFPNEWLARSYRTIMMATRQVATPPDFESQYQSIDDFIKDSKQIVFGVPASKGVVEGEVCIIKKESDISSLKKGQIVLTESPSSLINLVLPFAAGIVCDYGATLSHAAICARELGIPCVMGTKIGTKTYKNGQRVKVDGTTGKVELIVN
jgi:phosphoenolpyruvate synthase/pyruvate phosphate dikinase